MTWYFWILLIAGYLFLAIVFGALIRALDENERIITNDPGTWGFLWPLWLIGNILNQLLYVIVSGIVDFHEVLEKVFIKWTKRRK